MYILSLLEQNLASPCLIKINMSFFVYLFLSHLKVPTAVYIKSEFHDEWSDRNNFGKHLFMLLYK